MHSRAWVVAGTMLLVACKSRTSEPTPRAKSAATSAALVSAKSSSSGRPPAVAEPPLAGLEHHALIQKKVGFYGVLLPPGYEAAANRAKRFPIVVILHGSGSSEVRHGRLADGFGRKDVLYVLPRAPHAHEEVFTEQQQPGWTAWPTYPERWGKFDSATFPKHEIEGLDAARLYLDWIRQCVEDARRRYRTDGGRVVVFGHSQGAAFAHYFAIAHPDIVKAYFAYAGYYDDPPEGLDAAKVLKQHRIAAIIAHHEADPVVKVAGARALLDYFREHAVQHTGLVLPGGDHKVSDRIKDEVRRFIASQLTSTKG